MLKKAYDILTKFEIVVMSSMFIFLSFAIVADVVGRKLFAVSFSWLEELSRYCFVISTFMGASIAITRDDHPKMTAVQSFVGPKARKVLEIAADVVCIVLFTFVCYYSVLQTMNMARMGTMATSLKIPLFYIVAIIPVSTFGMVVRYILRLVGKLRKAPEEGGEAA